MAGWAGLKGLTAFQIGIIVRDMDAAVKANSEVYGVKIWFRSNVNKIDYYYKGKKRELELDIVVGYSKGTQIELIQVLRGEDNLYVELLLKERLVHSAVCVRGFDKKIAALKERGYEELHHGTIFLQGFTKVRFSYFDCRDDLGYVLEVAEVKSLGLNFGMPKLMLQAARLTGDASLFTYD